MIEENVVKNGADQPELPEFIEQVVEPDPLTSRLADALFWLRTAQMDAGKKDEIGNAMLKCEKPSDLEPLIDECKKFVPANQGGHAPEKRW